MKPAPTTLVTLAILALLAGCASPSQEERPAAPAPSKAVAPKPPPKQITAGTVRETMNAAGYTYVLVESGGRSTWAAGPETEVRLAQKVQLPAGMLMKDFHSRKLGRTFDWLWLVTSIEVEGARTTPATQPNVAAMHKQPATGAAAATAFDFSKIKRPEGGLTVAEIHARKDELAGKTVTLRAIAVKATPQVMDRNWIHLRDGTGVPGTNDLTVTSKDLAETGEVVLVTGTVAVNKEFGFGYKYEVMLENAKLTVE